VPLDVSKKSFTQKFLTFFVFLVKDFSETAKVRPPNRGIRHLSIYCDHIILYKTQSLRIFNLFFVIEHTNDPMFARPLSVTDLRAQICALNKSDKRRRKHCVAMDRKIQNQEKRIVILEERLKALQAQVTR
jgi:hypothetical protein